MSEQMTDNPAAEAPEPVEAPKQPRYEIPATSDKEAAPDVDEAQDTAGDEGGEDDGLLEAISDDDGDAGDDQSAADAEWAEVEINGKTYKVPADLKDGYLMQGDYTRKTQEVAEARKALEAERQQFQQQAQLQQQMFDDAATVRSIEQQLQQLDQTDWDSLSYDDPVEFQRKQWQRNQLIEQRNNTIGRINQAQQHALAQQQQDVAKRRQEGLQQLAKEIPGWSNETAKAIAEYAIGAGYSKDEVSNVLDPRDVKILDKARRYDELVAKSKARKKKPVAEAEPVPSSKGRSTQRSNQPTSRDSTADWIRKRNAQLAKRRGAGR